MAHRDASLGARARGHRGRQLLPPALAPRAGDRLADADRVARRSPRGLGAGERPPHHGRGRRHPGSRVPRPDRGAHAPRDGDPLRRAFLGALLDDLAPPRGRDAEQQPHRHAQSALRPARVRAGLPSGQARHDGRVRHAQHRHRRGLHRDRAQRAPRPSPVPQAAGLALPPVEGPRLAQHPLRLPRVGSAGDRPQPGGRVRDRDRRDRLSTIAWPRASTTTSCSARRSTASACRRSSAIRSRCTGAARRRAAS